MNSHDNLRNACKTVPQCFQKVTRISACLGAESRRVRSATPASFRLSTYRFLIPRKLKWVNLTLTWVLRIQFVSNFADKETHVSFGKSMAGKGYSFLSSSFARACRRSIWRQPSPYAHLHSRIENWRRDAHRQSLRPAGHGDVEIADVEHSGIENHRHFPF
jgi:hypothetical protein